MSCGEFTVKEISNAALLDRLLDDDNRFTEEAKELLSRLEAGEKATNELKTTRCCVNCKGVLDNLILPQEKDYE